MNEGTQKTRHKQQRNREPVHCTLHLTKIMKREDEQNAKRERKEGSERKEKTERAAKGG